MRHHFASLYLNNERELRQEAKHRLHTNFVRRWWCKKYNLPSTDPRFQDYTPEDLLIEFYEDMYERKPNLQLPGDEEAALATEPVFEETGDPLIDEIEKRLAKGENVDDLLDIMDPETRKQAPATNSVLKTDGSFFVKKDGE